MLGETSADCWIVGLPHRVKRHPTAALFMWGKTGGLYCGRCKTSPAPPLIFRLRRRGKTPRIFLGLRRRAALFRHVLILTFSLLADVVLELRPMSFPKEYTERCLKRAVKKARPLPFKKDPDWSFIELHPYIIAYSREDGYICHSAAFGQDRFINNSLTRFSVEKGKRFVKPVVEALLRLPEAEQAAKHGVK